MEGEHVELGWPHTDAEEEHRDDQLHNAITPAPPPQHHHPISDIAGLTGSLNELQQSRADHGQEIHDLWEHAEVSRNALYVAYFLIVGMAVTMILLVVSHLA